MNKFHPRNRMFGFLASESYAAVGLEGNCQIVSVVLVEKTF